MLLRLLEVCLVLRVHAYDLTVPESASFRALGWPESSRSICDTDKVHDASVTDDRPRLAARASKLKAK